MELIFRNFWIVFIFFGFVNYFLMKPRISKNFEEQVEIAHHQTYVEVLLSKYIVVGGQWRIVVLA